MADKVDEANHEAKLEVNGKLEEVNDVVDDLTTGDVVRPELPGDPDQPTAERLQRLKDELEAALDGIQEDVNAARISAADGRIRRLRARIRRAIRDRAKREEMLGDLKAARKAKRRITQPAVPVGAGVHDTDALIAATAAEVAELPLTEVAVPHPAATVLAHAGIRTVGDLLSMQRFRVGELLTPAEAPAEEEYAAAGVSEAGRPGRKPRV